MKKGWGICVLALLAALTTGCADQKPPEQKTGEFPFRVVYTQDGETYTIEDTVVCTYTDLDHSSWIGARRTWEAHLASGLEGQAILLEKENVPSILEQKRMDERIRLVLHYGTGGYYMGDPNANSMIHAKPHICYIETYSTSPKVTHTEATELSEAELETQFGIKLVEFTFQDPVDNTFG